MSEFDLNSSIAQQIRTTRQWQGRSFHVGEFVALLDGRVVAVGGSLDEALEELRRQEPDPNRGMICEVGEVVIDVIR